MHTETEDLCAIPGIELNACVNMRKRHICASIRESNKVYAPAHGSKVLMRFHAESILNVYVSIRKQILVRVSRGINTERVRQYKYADTYASYAE